MYNNLLFSIMITLILSQNMYFMFKVKPGDSDWNMQYVYG